MDRRVARNCPGIDLRQVTRKCETPLNPQNRTQVAVLMDVADLDVVMAAMQNPTMADAMAYDGVLPETLVLLVEA